MLRIRTFEYEGRRETSSRKDVQQVKTGSSVALRVRDTCDIMVEEMARERVSSELGNYLVVFAISPGFRNRNRSS